MDETPGSERRYPRSFIIYAERFPERVDTAKAIVREQDGLTPAVREAALRGIDHFDVLYLRSCESRSPDCAAEAFQGVEWIIGLYEPGEKINLLQKPLNTEPNSSER